MCLLKAALETMEDIFFPSKGPLLVHQSAKYKDLGRHPELIG